MVARILFIKMDRFLKKDDPLKNGFLQDVIQKMINRNSFKETNERERLSLDNKKSSEDLQLLN